MSVIQERMGKIEKLTRWYGYAIVGEEVFQVNLTVITTKEGKMSSKSTVFAPMTAEQINHLTRYIKDHAVHVQNLFAKTPKELRRWLQGMAKHFNYPYEQVAIITQDVLTEMLVEHLIEIRK